MKKYFGTDGIRGIANQTLTPELSFKLGRILGNILKKPEGKVEVLIGRDTRISGEMLEYALIAGLLSSGANCMRLGIVSTPAVGYLTKVSNASCGIMISASHNPYPDNGIKIFGSDGFKISDEIEREIERLIDEPDQLERPINDKIGTVEKFFEGQHKYLAYLQKTTPNNFENIKVAIDCANGATSNLAPHLFANLGCDCMLINNTPNGLNINDQCGSTHVEALQKFVVENEMDLGLAFDGDGDRVIAVDELGNIVDGDHILYILGQYFSEQNRLKDNVIVSTVMSNLGYYKALEASNIASIQTDVGDRNVLETMVKGNYSLGGEQSGHIIMSEYATTGDGLLTAVQLINVMVTKEAKLSELAQPLKKYPQVLKNIKVENKELVLQNERITEKINEVKARLNTEGRVLVRPSGTEPLIRVMVEATTDELANQIVDEIIETIKAISI